MCNLARFWRVTCQCESISPKTGKLRPPEPKRLRGFPGAQGNPILARCLSIQWALQLSRGDQRLGPNGGQSRAATPAAFDASPQLVSLRRVDRARRRLYGGPHQRSAMLRRSREPLGLANGTDFSSGAPSEGTVAFPKAAEWAVPTRNPFPPARSPLRLRDKRQAPAPSGWGLDRDN